MGKLNWFFKSPDQKRIDQLMERGDFEALQNERFEPSPLGKFINGIGDKIANTGYYKKLEDFNNDVLGANNRNSVASNFIMQGVGQTAVSTSPTNNTRSWVNFKQENRFDITGMSNGMGVADEIATKIKETPRDLKNNAGNRFATNAVGN